jgi:hypothetical protein
MPLFIRRGCSWNRATLLKQLSATSCSCSVGCDNQQVVLFFCLFFMEHKENHKSRFGYWRLILSICFVIVGYVLGYGNGVVSTESKFIAKKVNIVGVSFNKDDTIALNSFSCTPNDTDGDCSKQVIENYQRISTHHFDYCRKILNDYSQNTITSAKKLRSEILNNGMNFFPPPLSVPTAYCNDGTISYSENNSGTCSSHGGVRLWN